MTDLIYLDYAATTPLAPEVVAVMRQYMEEEYANPSAVYRSAAKSRQAVEKARREVAALIGAKPAEIFFTSGGTEADNWILISKAEAMLKEKGTAHIITSAIEHHAVLHTCQYLEERGVQVTYLPVSSDGVVDPEEVRRAIQPDTAIISIMTANNETGVLEPIAAISAIAHEHGILMHTDAVQAVGHIPVNVDALHVDALSISAHKLNGPKGIGCLYVRSGVKLRSFMHGGAQERGRRAGTENVAAIAGFGEAARIAGEHLAERNSYVAGLRESLLEKMQSELPDLTVNSAKAERLPGTLNITIPRVDAETLLIALDMRGVCASAGSACAAGSLDPSHVLLAMGRTYEQALSTIRLTLSHETTAEEVEQAAGIIAECASNLRSN